MSRPTRGHKRFLPVRGCHPLWPAFPDGSGSYVSATGLVRVRSPLLTESRLMSFPPGTEMFQFPGFASPTYGFSGRYPSSGWVAPFGNPRIKDRSRLPGAFRSVPRPSSPLGAKASTRCPCFRSSPPQRQPHASTADARPASRLVARGECGRSSSNNSLYKRPAPTPERRRRSLAYPCHFDARTLRRKTRKTRGYAHRLPAPVTRTTHQGLERSLRARGRAASPPYDVQRTEPHDRTRLVASDRMRRATAQGRGFPSRRPGRPPRPRRAGRHRCRRAWWARADLNGRPHAYQACALTS